jgi:hypothetical protein
MTGALIIAALAALAGVIFWGAVRSAAKRGAADALTERRPEPSPDDTPEPVYRVDGKVYVNGRWVREKKN